MAGQAWKSNRSLSSHGGDVTEAWLPATLTLTSLKRFMKRGPKRQGLWRWHCRELTVIWVARWDATATMNTASYIKAASVCGGASGRKTLIRISHHTQRTHVKHTTTQRSKILRRKGNEIKLQRLFKEDCAIRKANRMWYKYNDGTNITQDYSFNSQITLKDAS